MKQIYSYVDKYGKEMSKSLSQMVKIPAISPQSGGKGESKRADYLEKLIRSFGFKVKRYEYTDGFSVKRSNLVVKYGLCRDVLWIVPHMDTVSVGEKSLWDLDPFSGKIKEGKVYGRGASDNGQDVIAGIYALRALKESRLKPKYTYGLAIVADEETGSNFGVKALIKDKVFAKSAQILVPDSGNSEGTSLVITQKGNINFKITTKGKQVHASRPNAGVNAAFHGMKFATGLCEYLYRKYDYLDDVFYPKYSTFELTKHESNTGSINIVPGMDVVYMDCRILPKYDVDKIVKDAQTFSSRYAKKVKGLGIVVEATRKSNPPPAANPKSKIVQLLLKKVKAVTGKTPSIAGSGGGTVAGPLRQSGYMNSAVWSIKEEVAHRVNEYSVIEEMKDDAKVFASLFV